MPFEEQQVATPQEDGRIEDAVSGLASISTALVMQSGAVLWHTSKGKVNGNL